MSQRPINGARRRRTQEERSDETRQRILDAAFRLLRERGYSEFTTAEVAKYAKVSRGALVHHYASKTLLVSAAVDYVFESALRHGLARADAVDASDDPIQALLDEAVVSFFSDYFYVGLDLLLAGGKNISMRERTIKVVRNYREPLEARWIQVLVDAGMDATTADEVLWLTIDLVRGAAIRALWRNQPDERERYMRVWRQMVELYIEQSKLPE